MILTARTARIASLELKRVSHASRCNYDIHGNLPALEAVLQEIRQAEIDHVVVGGDVLPGPMPRETLACLMDLDIPVQCIYGNGESPCSNRWQAKEPAAVPEQYRPIIDGRQSSLMLTTSGCYPPGRKTTRRDWRARRGAVLPCDASKRE